MIISVVFNPNDLKKFINEIKSQKDNYSVFSGYTLIESDYEFFSSQIPKMVFNKNEELIYTSRAPIPSNKDNVNIKSYKQVCVYGFTIKALEKYSKVIEKTTFHIYIVYVLNEKKMFNIQFTDRANDYMKKNIYLYVFYY